MKIKFSKSQWNKMGKKAGWIKTAQSARPMEERTRNLSMLNEPLPRSEGDIFDEIYEILTTGGTYQTYSQLLNRFEEKDQAVAEKVLEEGLRQGGLFRCDNAGIMHARAKNNMKIKLSKSQWNEIGKRAGWMKTAQNQLVNTQPQEFRTLEPYVGTSGLCPICGEKTIIKNITMDGNFLVGTCNDSFNLKQWTSK